MRRRSFVGGVLAGGSALAGGVASAARVDRGSAKGAGSGSGAARAKIKPGDVPRRVFGKTGEKLTIIGQAGGRFGFCTFEEAKAITLRAYELGINYFDCAHVYWGGRSEEAFGEALQPFRKQVFITTKCKQRAKQPALDELAISLKRLRTDYVDLWQVHSVGSDEDLEAIFRPGGAIEAFEEAKKAGKCRFIGFTGHHDPAAHLKMLQLYDRWDSILLPLNPADPFYLSFQNEVLPKAVEAGIGIQGMKSLANGRLIHALSIKKLVSYALSLPIHCLSLGCTTIGQLEDDVRIARDFQPLTAEEVAQVQRQGKKWGGPALEYWKKAPPGGAPSAGSAG